MFAEQLKKTDFPNTSNRSLSKKFEKHDFWENAFERKWQNKTWLEKLTI